jgi:hypothetical protein
MIFLELTTMFFGGLLNSSFLRVLYSIFTQKVFKEL